MGEYVLPEKFASMTIHFGQREGKNLKEYMKDKKYVLIADLIGSGYKKKEIEDAVNSGVLKFACWPEERRLTDMFWLNDKETEKELEELADNVTKYCGVEMDEPAYGNFASIGAELGSQQIALAGLIYARGQGKLYELDVEDSPTGPQYFNAKNPFAKILFSGKGRERV